MKLLFDENLSFKLCARLSDLFPGSRQVQLVGLAEADDAAIWRYAGAFAPGLRPLLHLSKTLQPAWKFISAPLLGGPKRSKPRR
jgi:hypothetical protein